MPGYTRPQSEGGSFGATTAGPTLAEIIAALPTIATVAALPASPIESIQRGQFSIAVSTATGNATITAVVLAKSFIRFSVRIDNSNATIRDEMHSARLTTTTNLEVRNNSSSFGTRIVDWEVIEYV